MSDAKLMLPCIYYHDRSKHSPKENGGCIGIAAVEAGRTTGDGGGNADNIPW